MLGYVLLGFLAAFGAFCGLWAVFGWLLPEGGGAVLVCYGLPDEGIRSRYQWLKGTGLLKSPLLAVAEDGPEWDGLEICSREELISRLEWERRKFDGTGNGDHTGCHQRRGLSEL